MGCGASSNRLMPMHINDVQDAADIYRIGESTRVHVPLEYKMGEQLGQMGRIDEIEEIFDAVDDDRSGAISYNEFGQLFGNDVREEEVRDWFKKVDDIEHDGAVSREEFVHFHLTKFAPLDDDTFSMVSGRLLQRAEESLVIDPVPVTTET